MVRRRYRRLPGSLPPRRPHGGRRGRARVKLPHVRQDDLSNGVVRVYKKTTTVVGVDQGEETAKRDEQRVWACRLATGQKLRLRRSVPSAGRRVQQPGHVRRALARGQPGAALTSASTSTATTRASTTPTTSSGRGWGRGRDGGWPTRSRKTRRLRDTQSDRAVRVRSWRARVLDARVRPEGRAGEPLRDREDRAARAGRAAALHELDSSAAWRRSRSARLPPAAHLAPRGRHQVLPLR